MENKKITNAAKNWDRLVKACGYVMRVIGIVFIVLAVLTVIFGKEMCEAASVSLDLAFMKLYLTEECEVNIVLMQIYMVIGLLAGSAVCFFAQYASKLLRNILYPMKEGRPFEADIPVNLKKLAWIVLSCGAVLQITKILEHIILSKAYPMELIFDSSAIKGIEYSYTVDFNFVFVFYVIIFMSEIFSYGQRLQKESDETL